MENPSKYQQVVDLFLNHWIFVVIALFIGAIIALARFTDAVGTIIKNVRIVAKHFSFGRKEEDGPKPEERVFVREQPKELKDYLKSLPPLHAEKIMKEAYIGKWARWKGKVFGMSTEYGGGISVSINTGIDAPLLFASFSKDHKPELEQLRDGDSICVEGKIQDTFGRCFNLAECAIIPDPTQGVHKGDVPAIVIPEDKPAVVYHGDTVSIVMPEKKSVAEQKPAVDTKVPPGHGIDPKVHAFFMDMPSNFNAQAAAGLEANYVWEILLPPGRERGRTWFSVIIEKGQLTEVTQGKVSDPDLKILVSETDWLDIMRHKHSLQDAISLGIVKLRGDTALFMKLSKIFSF